MARYALGEEIGWLRMLLGRAAEEGEHVVELEVVPVAHGEEDMSLLTVAGLGENELSPVLETLASEN